MWAHRMSYHLVQGCPWNIDMTDNEAEAVTDVLHYEAVRRGAWFGYKESRIKNKIEAMSAKQKAILFHAAACQGSLLVVMIMTRSAV